MSAYNVRLYDYKHSQQLRIYTKAVNQQSEDDKKADIKNNDKDEKEKEEQEQTEPDYERSYKVSTNRTKQKIYEITRANTWDWFITLTFDRNKILAYEIESGIELLNGSGAEDDLMFFQLFVSGTVFRRINRTEDDKSGRFWARTLDGDLIAWVGDNYLVFSYTTPGFGFQGTDSVTEFMTNTVKIEING